MEERADELALRSPINDAYRQLQEYLRSTNTWGDIHAGVLRARPVAYFSAEFGLHESLPIYSGGLGVLAGDQINSASDLGVPLVAVGLFYGQGYFVQRLNREGWQQEEYIAVNRDQLPLELVTELNGEPLFITLTTRTGTLSARIWKLTVGRITLLLLDTAIQGNRPEDQELTARLYDGDSRVAASGRST